MENKFKINETLDALNNELKTFIKRYQGKKHFINTSDTKKDRIKVMQWFPREYRWEEMNVIAVGVIGEKIQVLVDSMPGNYSDTDIESAPENEWYNIDEEYLRFADSLFAIAEHLPSYVEDPFKQFYLLREEDRKEINDSLLLPSGEVIADGKIADGTSFQICTQGNVRILWKGEIYKFAQDFPKDLIRAIRFRKPSFVRYGEVIENNWYELTIFDKKGNTPYSELLDIDLSEIHDEQELKDIVLDVIATI